MFTKCFILRNLKQLKIGMQSFNSIQLLVGTIGQYSRGHKNLVLNFVCSSTLFSAQNCFFQAIVMGKSYYYSKSLHLFILFVIFSGIITQNILWHIGEQQLSRIYVGIHFCPASYQWEAFANQGRRESIGRWRLYAQLAFCHATISCQGNLIFSHLPYNKSRYTLA